MVGNGKVVVDCLRDADGSQGITFFCCKLSYLVGAVLGIIASDVQKVADVVGFEDGKYAFVVLLFFKFKAAGP